MEQLLDTEENLYFVAGPGAILAGQYRLDRLFGYGGDGLWVASDLTGGSGGNRSVLVKFYPEMDFFDQAAEWVARLGAVNSEQLVRIRGFGRVKGAPYMVTDAVNGERLDRWVELHPLGLSIQQAAPILRGLADALKVCHERRVVLRMLSPESVSFNPKTGVVKLFNFDLPPRHAGEVEPRPCCASLDALQGEPPAVSDDLFSYACIAYELLSGRHPFDGVDALAAQAERRSPAALDSIGEARNALLARALALEERDPLFSIEEFAPLYADTGVRDSNAPAREMPGAATAQELSPFAPPEELSSAAPSPERVWNDAAVLAAESRFGDIRFDHRFREPTLSGGVIGDDPLISTLVQPFPGDRMAPPPTERVAQMTPPDGPAQSTATDRAAPPMGSTSEPIGPDWDTEFRFDPAFGKGNVGRTSQRYDHAPYVPRRGERRIDLTIVVTAIAIAFGAIFVYAWIDRSAPSYARMAMQTPGEQPQAGLARMGGDTAAPRSDAQPPLPSVVVQSAPLAAGAGGAAGTLAAASAGAASAGAARAGAVTQGAPTSGAAPASPPADAAAGAQHGPPASDVDLAAAARATAALTRAVSGSGYRSVYDGAGRVNRDVASRATAALTRDTMVDQANAQTRRLVQSVTSGLNSPALHASESDRPAPTY